jgi:hypothetical protein
MCVATREVLAYLIALTAPSEIPECAVFISCLVARLRTMAVARDAADVVIRTNKPTCCSS